MAMSRRGVAVLFLVGCIGGCVTTPPATPTPLQVQAFQSRGYENGKTMVFGSVVSVFQDLGYIIDSADKETGFITASSPTGDRTSLLEALSGMQSSGQTRATAFIEEIRPDFVTVRLNFVDTRRRSNGGAGVTHAVGWGMGDRDTPILDPKTYQNAFERIEAAIFVRTGMRAQSPTAGAL
jgi:hypothetical protein